MAQDLFEFYLNNDYEYHLKKSSKLINNIHNEANYVTGSFNALIVISTEVLVFLSTSAVLFLFNFKTTSNIYNSTFLILVL